MKSSSSSSRQLVPRSKSSSQLWRSTQQQQRHSTDIEDDDNKNHMDSDDENDDSIRSRKRKQRKYHPSYYSNQFHIWRRNMIRIIHDYFVVVEVVVNEEIEEEKDDNDDICNNNNNNNKRQQRRRRRRSSTRPLKKWYNIIVCSIILVVILFLFIQQHVLYHYYYVYHYVYRPHYTSDLDLQSRSQRFPTVHQRIQLYMSQWYIPPHIHHDHDCRTTGSILHRTAMNTVPITHHSSPTWNMTTTGSHPWIDYSSEEYTDTNKIKYYTLTLHDPYPNVIDPSVISTTQTTTTTVAVVTNQVQIGTIFYTDIRQLHLCYQNTSYSIRYYCRDMMESILVGPPYHIPVWIQRFLCTYTVLLNFVLFPYVDRFHYNIDDSSQLHRPPPIMVQFSDETESWIYTTTTTTTTTPSTKPLHLLWHNVSHLDQIHHPKLPHIKKIRYALHKTDIDRIMTRTIHNDYYDHPTQYDTKSSSCALTSKVSSPPPPPQLWTGMTEFQPILWLLNENRHFKYTWDINRYDQTYATKKNMSVFRGMLTGPDIDPTIEHNDDDDDYTNCMSLPRCRLVYQTYDSIYVDAKITDTLNKVPDTIQHRNITGTHLWKEEILSYKGIIILEGNDVSSGLKWAMISNSVVLMSPNITYSSWMMEELLEPYIHYIPIDLENDNIGPSIETQTIWMLQHEPEVQRIIHRAKLWILDLYYHPDARRDMQSINHGILQQYQQYFRPTQEAL